MTNVKHFKQTAEAYQKVFVERQPIYKFGQTKQWVLRRNFAPLSKDATFILKHGKETILTIIVPKRDDFSDLSGSEFILAERLSLPEIDTVNSLLVDMQLNNVVVKLNKADGKPVFTDNVEE